MRPAAEGESLASRPPLTDPASPPADPASRPADPASRPRSCKQNQDLLSFYAVVMGLDNAAVSRLRLTWEVR